jgi:hypothetical protein
MKTYYPKSSVLLSSSTPSVLLPVFINKSFATFSTNYCLAGIEIINTRVVSVSVSITGPARENNIAPLLAAAASNRDHKRNQDAGHGEWKYSQQPTIERQNLPVSSMRHRDW